MARKSASLVRCPLAGTFSIPLTISLDHRLVWRCHTCYPILWADPRPLRHSLLMGGAVGLDLELCGVVREVAAGEVVPKGSAPAVSRLRDSHHALARLLARGLNETEAAHITGYALS